ncbi:MAG: M20 family metallopeptidase [Tissierellia bacterium]|nr:M20 family metallopeptidase [Tissierellia bacterium]
MKLTQEQKHEALELLIELVETPSTYFNEAAIMELAQDRAQKLGLPVSLHNYRFDPLDFDGLNLHGTIGPGSDGPLIYLGGHLDTVNITSGWTRDPLKGTREGNRLYGTGVLDMKAGSAAVLIALGMFYRDHPDFKGRIIYHFASVEEGPYGLGTTFFLKDILKEKPDFAIITEPSAALGEIDEPAICLGAKGGYNYKVHLKGASAHAATPELGISAADDGAKVVQALNRIQAKTHPVLGSGASCVIGFHSGGGAASVPGEAEVEVFRHVVPGESIDTVRQEVEQAIKDLDLKSETTLRFRASPAEGFDGGFPPYYTDQSNEYIQTLVRLMTEKNGAEPVMTVSNSIGDFNLVGGLRQIPTVLVGPLGDKIHQSDEYVELDTYYQLIELLYEFLVAELT